MSSSTDSPPEVTSSVAQRVHRELHERPALDVQIPAHLHHCAYLLGEDQGQRAEATALMKQLFADLGVDTTGERVGNRHAIGEKTYANGDCLRITWELHSEFCSYTFTHMTSDQAALQFGPLKLPEPLPAFDPQWERFLAIDLLVVNGEQVTDSERQGPFSKQRLYGSLMHGGSGQAWTAFSLDDREWGHYIVKAGDFSPLQLGRHIKRILDIEVYYHLTLMPLNEFRQRSVDLRKLEMAFTRETSDMFDALVDASPDEERRWLALLTELSAQVTRLKEAMRFRIGAAESYHRLFHRQLKNMEAGRAQAGTQSLGSFLIGRTDPAIRGYNNFNERLDSLSRGLNRASNMLGTRVELTVQKQNLDLLQNMARQGQQQLMLQRTVEGLAIIVLSYYLTGLLGYVVGAVHKAGWLWGDPVIWQGAMVPVAIGFAVSVNMWVHRQVAKLKAEQ